MWPLKWKLLSSTFMCYTLINFSTIIHLQLWNSEIWFLSLFESTDNGTQTKQHLIKNTPKKKKKHTDVMASPSKLCPPYPRRIWKRNFVSPVRLSCTDTNLSWTRSLSKTLFKPEEFENNGFAEAFRKWWHYDNCKMAGYCCFFQFLRCSVDGKQIMRFPSTTSVFKFLRRNSMDRA